MTPINSLVVPIYNNADSISALVDVIEGIDEQVDDFEVIFVLDGSPDDSRELLVERLKASRTRARLVDHSRNFGAFAAVRTGLSVARGRYIAVMAADLQEPPNLIIEFFDRLATNEVDVVAGKRASRNDRGDIISKIYWRLYRLFILKDVPAGGVDIFACTTVVRDVICSMEAANTSLIAQLFWVGFRRDFVAYARIPRSRKSGWTMRSKFRYLSDSVFAFTDLPVRLLWIVGTVSMTLGLALGSTILVAHITGAITVPGYAAIALILLFFLSLNSLGLGIIGSYVWRAYENTKRRPGAIVRDIVALGEDGDVMMLGDRSNVDV